MRGTLLPGAVLLLLLVLAAPGGASSGAVSFWDAWGDANGLSGQEHGGGNGISTGRASMRSADLRRVVVAPRYRIARNGARRLRALDVSFTLTAPPGNGLAYHLSATGRGCSSLIVDYYRFRNGTTRTQLRDACDGGVVGSTALRTAAVDGRTITVKVPASALPTAVRRGGRLSRLYAYTRGNIGDAPVFPFPVTPVQIDSKESPRDLFF